MFGCLVAGRMVDTNFRTVDSTHVVIDIPQADSFSHVVVFLTGQQAFPEGFGGAVYFCWPSENVDGPCWHYLGNISNEKPSAFFKVGRLRPTLEANGLSSPNSMTMSSRFGVGVGSTVAQLGIAVETLSQLSGMAPDAKADTPAAAAPAFLEFARSTAESLFNYVSSFSVTPNQLGSTVATGETFVPFSSLRRWYENFERRLSQDPYFWKK